MPKSAMQSGAMKSAKLLRRKSARMWTKFSSSNVKAVALTRAPENVGENQDISLEQFSHSAWLAIFTCSFSGVFVCNLWFVLIVRVNVVSCRATF